MKFLAIVLLAIIALSFSSVNAASNLECEFCDFIVGYAEKYVQQNATEAQIQTDLEKACKFVPESLQATCDSLVSVYTPQIIQMLINKESVTQICTQIELCSSVKQSVGTVQCSICGFIVGKLENYIASSQSETEIVDELNDACKIFGGIAATCESLVQQYVPQLIQLLENNETPSQVCSVVGLCPSASRMIRKNTMKF